MPKTSIGFGARFLALPLAAVLLGALPGPAHASGLHDADGGRPGPFAAGHTSFVLEQSRPAAGWPSTCGTRAIAPTVVRGAPRATYVMDPYFGGLPETSSADWEARGYDPAYEAVRPSRRGPFPLVVYSSGSTFPAWANLFLGTRLASHGYVLAAIQHTGEGSWPWYTSDNIFTVAYNRPRDVSFVLTELLAMNRRNHDVLRGVIDPWRVAVGGHSFGGYSALALTAGDDTLCDSKVLLDIGDPVPPDACGPTPVDRRFSAVVTLEGSGHLLRFAELERVSVPSLIVGGTVEQQSPVLDEWRTWMARSHAAITGPASLRVDLQGTDHFSYSNYCDGVTMLHDRGAISEADWSGYYGAYFCNAPLPVAEGHRLIDRFVVAFLDKHVRDRPSPGGRESLSRVDAEEPGAELFRTERCGADADAGTEFTYRPHRGQCEVGVKDPAAWF